MNVLIRIENVKENSGETLFNTCLFEGMLFKDRHQDMPTPWEEGWGDIMTNDHFCAYTSIKKLKQWIFEEELYSIIENGYNVYRILVTTCTKSKYQAIYLKTDIIKKIDISHLFYN